MEYIDSQDSFSSSSNQLYDIVEDPEQKNNLYNESHPAVPGLNFLIAQRMSEIKEISFERIVKNFGMEIAESVK